MSFSQYVKTRAVRAAAIRTRAAMPSRTYFDDRWTQRIIAMRARNRPRA